MADGLGVPLIEDACEGLGSSIGGRPLGSYGVASTFAFYPNKQITTGEGGMVVTDDAEMASTLRSLRNQGRDEDGTWLRHVQLGFNYRLDELSAAIGVAQMERRAELAAGRARVVAAYARALGDRDWVRLPVGRGWRCRRLVRLCGQARPADRSQPDHRGDRRRGRAEQTVLQPAASPAVLPERPSVSGEGDFPVTERVAASTLALPFSPVLPDEDVAYVAEVLSDAVARQFAT